MMTTSSDFDLVEATTIPEDLVPTAVIDTTPVLVKTVKKEVPDQLWSVVRALDFIEGYRKGLRDPAILAATVTTTIQPAVQLGLTSADLDALYVESSVRRAEIELDPIAEDVYKIERDPKGMPTFVTALMEAGGLEITLQKDLDFEIEDAPIVDVTDPIVSIIEAEAESVNPQAAEAARIAVKLGLEADIPDGYAKHLIIPEAFEVDSTDPYVKTIGG